MLLSACLCASISLAVNAVGAQTAPAPPVDPAIVLRDSDAPALRREEAARAVLLRKTPQSRQLIVAVLENTADAGGQIAASRAIATGAEHSADYLVPLRLMMGADRSLTDAGALALAAYKDHVEALRLLTNFASSRQQRETDRLIAIRAIGNTSSKAAAEFLITLVLRDDDTQRIAGSAADALAEMTGRYENGQEAGRWKKWWEDNSGKPEAQWRQELQAYQASRYMQMRLRYEQLTGELQSILTRAYENTPAAQQSSLLLAYLRSTDPEIRRNGAVIVHAEAMAARPISPEAREQLRSMVSDNSREVRLAVATAMLAANDPAAFEALLLQIEREPDPTVRAALAAPLASVGDLRAVPALLKLLNDPLATAATAGAAALRELGVLLRDTDPKLAKQVSNELQAVLARLGDAASSLPLREAIAEALVPLRDPGMVPTLYRLLREAGSARIRWAALRALGELRDPKTADTVARYLEDRESGVRLEAVRSLGKTSASEFGEELFRRMSPVEETDPSVREEAWNVLQTTFVALPLEQLPTWIQRFSADPGRRSVVLRAILRREEARKDAPLIASANQRLGSALMELNQPVEAAAEYKAALAYYQSLPDAQEMVVEQLVGQYLLALVRSRNYSEAAVFSSELLGKQASYQQTVGVLLRNEVRSLMEQNRSADALALIDTSRKISPVLAQRYLDELTSMERRLRLSAPATDPALAVP